MLRTKNFDMAREHARSHAGYCYGISVFDGFYYTGTEDALRGVGVADIQRPIPRCAWCPNGECTGSCTGAWNTGPG